MRIHQFDPSQNSLFLGGRAQRALLLVLAIVCLSSCGGLMGAFRKDSDEQSVDYGDDEVRAESGKRADTANAGRGEVGGQRRQETVDQPHEKLDWKRTRGGAPRVQQSEPSTADTPVYLPRVQRLYTTASRATRNDFIDQSQDEGSLWASVGQTNYFFTKNRVRGPGDLVTVILDDDLYREILAETKESLTYPEREVELNLAQETLTAKFIAERLGQKRDEVITSSAATEGPSAASASPKAPSPGGAESAQKQPKSELTQELAKLAPRARSSDVDLAKSLDLKVGDPLIGEIIERFPNGNYRIRAVKKIAYKNGAQRSVSVVGIVKNSDISDENDGVHSGRLYEHRVEVAH